jgi:hypothetical protein
MYGQGWVDGGFYAVEETQELLMAVSWLALTNDGSVRHVQSGEQGGGSVPLIVVGLSLRQPRAQRQNGLGAIQSLNLLFSSTLNQGFLGRVQV